MIEFFVSKFWAFLVSIVIMGVLVQGLQMDSQSDRNEALDDMAEDLEALFDEFAAAGEGLETTVRFASLLPATSTLTLFNGYGILEGGDREVRFSFPDFTMQLQTEQGEVMEVESLVLCSMDSLRLVNDAEGPKMTKLIP